MFKTLIKCIIFHSGIGTALKILFSPAESLNLSRHEVVAFLNAFGRVATSLIELDKFRSLMESSA
jgi:Endoplasmic Reticulum Oxidoreductin 1 (ERO1)